MENVTVYQQMSTKCMQCVQICKTVYQKIHSSAFSYNNDCIKLEVWINTWLPASKEIEKEWFPSPIFSHNTDKNQWLFLQFNLLQGVVVEYQLPIGIYIDEG